MMEELSVARLVSICDGGHSHSLSLSLEFVIDGDMKAVLTNMILDSKLLPSLLPSFSK